MQLVRGLDKSRFVITVVTIYDGGDFDAEVDAIEGVTRYSLDKKSRWDLGSVWRLWRILRRVQPEIIHGYMAGANELSLLFGKILRAKVVWGLRASNLNFADYAWGKVGARLFRAGARLSRFADLIIVNSRTGRDHYVGHGYVSKRMVVIHNGIDTQQWRPDREAGIRFRQQNQIPEDAELIGIIGRLDDAIKGHGTFLQAAALTLRHQGNVVFLCLGRGSAQAEGELRRAATDLGISEHVVLTGESREMLGVYNALDVCTSASFGEGFSNVIGEAMACGVPCIVTDVGDSAVIVGNHTQVTPAGDAEALMRAWMKILQLSPEERIALSRESRERVNTEFSVAKLAQATEAHLLALSHREGRPSRN